MLCKVNDNLVTYHSILYCIGYFSSLNMEFQLRQENISIVVMPIPFVYTSTAIENSKFKQSLIFEPGISSEVKYFLI